MRHRARFWLHLLLVLQVAGLFGHAHAAVGRASKANADQSQLSALTQIVGFDIAICHHGDDQGPGQGSSDDCCAGGLCHCLSHFLDAPSSSGTFTQRIAAAVEAPSVLRFAAPVLAPQIGAKSARGPPVSV